MTENTLTENLANNHLVGVIEAPEAATQAVQELQEAGYRDPVILYGEEGARQINAKGEHGGIFGRILGMVEDHLSEATNFMKQYEEAALNGKQVIAVEVPNLEEAENAQGVLERNGALNIRFFGKLAVADLTPETNPSGPAGELPEQQSA